MSDPHHVDPIEENLDSHPLKVAIGVGIGAIALVIGIILLVQLAIGLYATRSPKDDPAMTSKAIAERLQPVAKLALDPNASATPTPAAPAAVPAAAPAAGKPASGAPGKATYDSICAVCHSAGVAGAPKFGDKAAWAPRVKGGKDALYASAMKGKGAMPPKGGNASLSDADLKAAVDYMVAAAK